MNKILFITCCLLFLLIGCSKSVENTSQHASNAAKEETITPEQSNRKSTVKPEAKKVKNDNNDLEKLYNAYLTNTYNYIKNYGILKEDDQLSGENQGLAYIDLIDFNNDKRPELYVISKTPDNTYKEEIWSFSKDKAVLIFTKDFGNDGLVGDAERAITNHKGKVYLLETTEYSAGSRGDTPNGSESSKWISVSEMDNSKFIDVKAAMLTEQIYDDEEIPRYKYEVGTDYNDLLEVSKEEYFTSVAPFENKKVLINSDGGSKSLAFDYTNNDKKINEFVQHLRNKAGMSDNKTNVGNTTASEEKEIESFLSFFVGMASFSKNQYSDLDLMKVISNGLYGHKFKEGDLTVASDKDLIAGEITYYPFAVEQVDRLTEKLFGVSVERTSHINYPELEEEWEYEVAKYEDGYFYIAGPDVSAKADPDLNGNINSIMKMSKIEEGLFYVEFKSNYNQVGHAIVNNIADGSGSFWRLIHYSDNKVLTQIEIESYSF